MEAARKKIDPHITWAGEYCKHCFTCINICPVDNLEFKGDEMLSLGKCIHCQLCEKYCPDYAIEADSKKTAEEAAGSRKASSPAKAKPKTKTKVKAAEPRYNSSGQKKAGGKK